MDFRGSGYGFQGLLVRISGAAGTVDFRRLRIRISRVTGADLRELQVRIPYDTTRISGVTRVLISEVACADFRGYGCVVSWLWVRISG